MQGLQKTTSKQVLQLRRNGTSFVGGAHGLDDHCGRQGSP